MIDGNGKQAAIRAGYAEQSAAVIAAQNLIKPNVKAEIVKLKAEKQERTGWDERESERNLLNLLAIAIEQGNVSAGVSAARELNQLHGLYPGPGQAVQVNFNPHCTARGIGPDGQRPGQIEDLNSPKGRRGEGLGPEGEDK